MLGEVGELGGRNDQTTELQIEWSLLKAERDGDWEDVISGGIRLKLMQMPENDVLEVEMDTVIGEGKGISILFFWGGGSESSTAGNREDMGEGPIHNRSW